MTPISTPTGRRIDRDGVPYAVVTRTYAAPREVVWAAVTDPERMNRWVGTWTGDLASGEIAFTMTAEGEDARPERWAIEECVPPHRFAAHSLDEQPWAEDQRTGDGITWRLVVELTEADGSTTLTLAQDLAGGAAADIAASVGPGWEYYLDRLGASLADADPASVVWDGYEARHAEHYRRLFG